MITVYIDSGICGLKAEVKAFRIQRKSVGVVIKSDCEQVMTLNHQLQKLDMLDVLKPINKNAIYEKAGRCSLHPGCPVPCGVIKAAEVELGLALMKDIRIVFQNDNQVADDAT